MIDRIDLLKIKPENYKCENMGEIDDIINPFTELNSVDKTLINGLVLLYQPRKIVEIGISAGGSSIIILNAMKDITDAKLYSVDINANWYRNAEKNSGWAVNEYFPHLTDKWNLHIGVDYCEVAHEIGYGIDMLFIDSAHRHPIETINFLCAFPYLKENAVVIVHDTVLYASKLGFLNNCYASKYLTLSVTADKYEPYIDHAPFVSNITAFQINPHTTQYINNVFESLTLPWYGEISDELLNKYREFINRHYTKHLSCIFDKSMKFNALFENELNDIFKKGYVEN